ncbi:TonB-dependent receptor [Aliiglaciecola sp. 2_MG-2023]|uniref:TonB-dependent receptor n=1 Tax=Alteromonadaceae TaxID=72275 RepID=UPI0026E36B91|nr:MULTISPECIES: TonB-dependent receptor [unclassified Aliiglaciecola]MDO6710365.1 TonB-dependent receptor [Aliiglaciecola sp. 2_MG-2023]MDO6751512.1 TonB-dependent receptor [Aliiglaciecola sp. 1_MG-2023]
MKMIKTTLALACFAALSCQSALADEGGIQGLLTDKSQTSYIQGAEVNIKELGQSTVSKRDGSFRFANLPEGNYTLVVKYLGTPTIEVPVIISGGKILQQDISLAAPAKELENVIVYGQRAGQASAINLQRVADSIKSIVSADAIGQFPDQNAAEALQRLPGLSIERDQGEGRFVGIRGIDPNLNNVTINGVNVPSPEGGVRSVALDVIPSELIQGLEVSKSVTSDMDADAIGGSIEVKSLSAFDRQGTSASINVQASQNQLRDETSPKISGSVTNVFDDVFGVAAALSYAKRDFGSDNIESNGDDEIEQRYYSISRERIGAAVNLDFRPDFNNRYYLRTLYSRFADDEYRMANTFTFDGEDSEIERGSKDREETQTILSISAGAEHHLDDWLVEYQLGYSKADEDDPQALYYTFVGENMAIDSDMQGQIPQITQDAAAMDLANYELDEVSLEKSLAEDTETMLKADFTRMFDLQEGSFELKFGAKYRAREKTTEADIFIYDGDFDGIDPTMFAAAQPDWGLGSFGPGLDRAGLRNYFNQNGAGFELAELDSEVESNGASYVSNEDIFAAYIMGRYEWQKLTLVAGVRYEDTDFNTSGMRVELIENEQTDVEEVVNTPWNSERSYDHLLPSLNMRYEFTEKLIARAAFTQTISRPKFEDAAAYQIIESKTEEDEGVFITEREAEVGNPELNPFESDNFDLTLEYYPGDIGVLSAGYFYKNIDNFVIVADVADLPEWDGFDEVMQPINGESAKVSGVELSWVKAFDNGLLLSANGTFSSSEAITLLDGERFETSLPNQSDKIGNFTVGYESNLVSLRLTMTYKSENLEEIDGDLIRMEDNHQQLDFTSKYFIEQNMYLYFNAINITDEGFYNYFDQRSVNAQYEEYGRTFELGFSWML